MSRPSRTSHLSAVRPGVALSLLALLLLAGCASQVQRTTETLPRGDGPPRIVLMPIDLELSVLSAGGVEEPRAEWTAAAHEHVRAAFAAEARVRGMELFEHDPARGDATEQRTVSDLVKLHRAVGQAILLHKYLPGQQLPSKEADFDWSLGPEVATIARLQQADYALFFFMRDSYASSGRVALIVVAAVMGVGVPGGAQVGFASLVDLNNGDVVWFNRFARGTGDLRTADGAREMVRVLLDEAPR